MRTIKHGEIVKKFIHKVTELFFSMGDKRKMLVSLANSMQSEIYTFSLSWDSIENKDFFVKSIGKYAKLKRENMPMYDKIK